MRAVNYDTELIESQISSLYDKYSTRAIGWGDGASKPKEVATSKKAALEFREETKKEAQASTPPSPTLPREAGG